MVLRYFQVLIINDNLGKLIVLKAKLKYNYYENDDIDYMVIKELHLLKHMVTYKLNIPILLPIYLVCK